MGAASAIKDKFEAFEETGGIIGASVSSAFLLLIGFLNAFVFFKLVQELREIQRTGEYRYRHPVLDALGGTINNTSDGNNGRDDAKKLRQHFPTSARRDIHPYFTPSFDTATEVSLLSISAMSTNSGFPAAVILIFPALFTAGMSLIDTLDGIFMANVYGWAFVNPVKKI
ncbi:hypothetical protein BGX34_001980 [Mortierella sp. NVP85]|nr:hypothetical protein BGX34_001980 [Mortierella sp. NVP85]